MLACHAAPHRAALCAMHANVMCAFYAACPPPPSPPLPPLPLPPPSPPIPPPPMPPPSPSPPALITTSTYTVGMTLASADGACDSLFPNAATQQAFQTSLLTEYANAFGLNASDVRVGNAICAQAGQGSTGRHRRAVRWLEAGGAVSLSVRMELQSTAAVQHMAEVQLAEAIGQSNINLTAAIQKTFAEVFEPGSVVLLAAVSQAVASPPPPMPPPTPPPPPVPPTSASAPQATAPNFPLPPAPPKRPFTRWAQDAASPAGSYGGDAAAAKAAAARAIGPPSRGMAGRACASNVGQSWAPGLQVWYGSLLLHILLACDGRIRCPCVSSFALPLCACRHA